MCTVDNIGQSETQKYVCTVCSEKDMKCVQCVQCVHADGEGSDVIGQREVARQMSYRSSINICIWCSVFVVVGMMLFIKE